LYTTVTGNGEPPETSARTGSETVGHPVVSCWKSATICATIDNHNRPLLIKEAESVNADELDELVNDHVQDAIARHFFSRGLAVESTPVRP